MKAVIPAAGLGLRFLPLTKEQPKEMLPVVDKPTIQYVVEEALAAGITDILIVTGRGKRAVEDHFDKAPDLETMLQARGMDEQLQMIREISNMADIHFVRQKEPRGLGDAVLCARRHVGHEPFAVMLGDTINIANPPVVTQLMDVFEERKASVLAVERVAREKIQDYGIIDGVPITERLYAVRGLVEKPSPDQAPSDLGITGTYVLTPGIFQALEQTVPDARGEVQLTDALRLLLRTEEIYGFWFEGKRYDIGDKLGWLKTHLELSLRDPRFSDELRRLLG